MATIGIRIPRRFSPPSPVCSTTQPRSYSHPKPLTLGIRFGETAKAYPFPTMEYRSRHKRCSRGQCHSRRLLRPESNMQYPLIGRLTVRPSHLKKRFPRDTVYPFLLRDQETGSTWNLKGEAIAGPMQNKTLQQLPAHNAFWFAWATFWQNTGIY